MSKRLKSNIALLCALCLVWVLLCGFTSDSGAYPAVPVYVDGILTTQGYMVEGRTYLSVREFASVLELPLELEPTEGAGMRASLGGVDIEVESEGRYMCANGRYFYLASGPRVIGGEYCLPAAELARLFSAPVQWDTATSSTDIDTTHMSALRGGDEYYNAEDLEWLSKIINAESGNQSLEGMMGVGNVVMNRVNDPTCPDTVYEVIFDTRYGVQFSPVESGGIYAEPNELSVVAAKLCLEGYGVVGGSLYFVNPQTGSTAWFRDTRTFVVTIGDHDFYA